MYKLIISARSAVLVWLTHRLALPILKLIRQPEKFPYPLESLQQFPEGTMGRMLASFLEEKKLDLLPYYARHDMKHILLEYDTTDEGEGCLQCFMLGNGHLSFPVVATVLYCFSTMPEHWIVFRQAFKRGRASQPVANLPWFCILHTPVKELQQMIALKQPL
ncbi:MAG: hypothetical protein QM687_05355 [Ferruginibacter sp.]